VSNNNYVNFIFAAIARVALDQRLGCLAPSLAPGSDAQKMIDAVGTFFKNVGNLELKIPFWRLFPTPTWNKYINALDTIRRYIIYSFIVKKLVFKSRLFCTYGPSKSILEFIAC